MRSKDQLFPDRYLVTHAVLPNDDGVRLDSFLKSRYRRRSRETLKRAISEGIVRVVRAQGPHLAIGRLKAATQLLSGDTVEVLTERKNEPDVNFNYQILHEDKDLLIVDKPAPLPVHPAGRYFFHTLLVHLRTRGFTEPLPAEKDYYLVHRIDKETSGVLVLTKEKELCSKLHDEFYFRRTQKRYLAIIHGHPPEKEFEVGIPIKRDRLGPIGLRMIPANGLDDGQEALTQFRVLKETGDFSLVECFPKTGRQHQIRVHLKLAGHPIVGDKLYSLDLETALRFFSAPRSAPRNLSPELMDRLLLPRQALHATSIAFKHPRTGKEVEFSSPLPADLKDFISRAEKPMSRPSPKNPTHFPLWSPTWDDGPTSSQTF